MRRYSFAFVAIMVIAIACASGGYPVASAQYDADSRAYQDAFDKLKRAQNAGQLTHAQDVQVGNIVAEVRAADALTYADLQTWKESGKEPSTFRENADRLRRAQGELINLAAEVK